jgi:hypothetical protein
VADDNLYRFHHSELELIVEGLREEAPDNIPFRGANILFDMTIDEDLNTYIAYYGNRTVFKVSKNGEISTIYNSEAPFSPHGVDVFEGEVYVLESSIGDGKWWRFWDRQDDEIVPRVIKIDSDGVVEEIFSYRDSNN